MIEVKIPQGVRSLSAPERTVFDLYEAGKSWPQICKAMHLPYDEAKVLLAQCRGKGHSPDEKKRSDNIKMDRELKETIIKEYESGLSSGQIAIMHQLNPSTVSSNIANWIKAGLIKKRAEPAETKKAVEAAEPAPTVKEIITDTSIAPAEGVVKSDFTLPTCAAAIIGEVIPVLERRKADRLKEIEDYSAQIALLDNKRRKAQDWLDNYDEFTKFIGVPDVPAV